MGRRESPVETYLHQQVTLAGGTTRKHKGRINDPDRIVIWPKSAWLNADVHFVEVKKDDKPRKGQARELKRLSDMGCVALYLDSKEMVDLYVHHWRRTSG